MLSLPIDWYSLAVTAGKIAGAYLLAMPTGWWTEKEGRAAGIRTLPIVAMASCGYLLVLHDLGGADGIAARSRVLQGLVAGIGFVGGGAIVKEGLNVKGTSTAASIWNMGAIGAAMAFDRWQVAVVLAVLNLITLEGLVPIKRKIDAQQDAKSRLSI